MAVFLQSTPKQGRLTDDTTLWQMDIARSVAIDLLKDKPDGTFVVRPAGANKVHKYTLDLV